MFKFNQEIYGDLNRIEIFCGTQLLFSKYFLFVNRLLLRHNMTPANQGPKSNNKFSRFNNFWAKGFVLCCTILSWNNHWKCSIDPLPEHLVSNDRWNYCNHEAQINFVKEFLCLIATWRREYTQFSQNQILVRRFNLNIY